MKILIITTLKDNLTEAKVKPLINLPTVEEIFYVSDRPGPCLKNVKYYPIPKVILKIFRNNSFIRFGVKFAVAFSLAIVKRPNLVMGYSLMPHGLTAVIIGRVLGISSIVHVIGGAPSVIGGGFTCGNNLLLKRLRKDNSLIERLVLGISSLADFITVTGVKTKEFLVSKGIDAKKIIVLSSVVDIKRFYPDNTNRKIYDLIILSELIETKRVDIFLEVVLRLTRRGFNLKGVILGEGPFKNRLEKLCISMGIGEKVYFAGYKKDVENYLRSARIFLLPSQSEGLSLAMLEAMACGVVPVVSNVGDMADAVKDGINGRLIEKEDLDGFVLAVEELLKDPQRLALYSESGIKTVREKFTIEKAGEIWREIFYRIDHGRKKGLLVWCLNRLKAMHALEICYRMMKYIRTKLLYLDLLLIGRKGHLLNRTVRRAIFFIDREDIEFIKKNFIKASSYNNIYSSSRIETFERDMYRLGLDVINGIKSKAGLSRSRIREAWEPNRFQWLVSYGQRYVLERDEALVERMLYVIADWIKRNPFLKGVNWVDPLESSLRLFSWTWIYYLIKDSQNFDKDFETIFLRSVYLHTRFIEANLSRYSSANNHLIGEAGCLFMVGLLFPMLRGAERMVEIGRSILEREIKKQVYPDGVSKEQSSWYHMFILEIYLVAILIGEKNGIFFSNETYRRVERMCEFLAHISDEKGSIPNIGDRDDGYAFRFGIFQGEISNAFSILNIASILFKRPDFKKVDDIDEKTVFLLGRNGYDIFYSLKKGSVNGFGSVAFKDGGYYIMKDGSIRLIFDCGELGYNSLAAHGHSDALSFILDVEDKQIFIDPGTYLYNSGDHWRDYFRSTRAHNTLEIDNLDQSEMKGPFLWGYKAHSFLKSWETNDRYESICGYHTGYKRLKDPVVHEREIILDKDIKGIFLKDTLHAKKRHAVSIYYHIHPDCYVKLVGENLIEIRNGDMYVYMKIDPCLNVNIFNASEIPLCGWYSERFGVKRGAWTIRAEGVFEKDSEFFTAILLKGLLESSTTKGIFEESKGIARISKVGLGDKFYDSQKDKDY